MSPITPLLYRLPFISGTLVSAALTLGVGYCLLPTTASAEYEEGIEATVVGVAETPQVAERLRLELEVQSADSGCMYYSSFDVGPVEVASDEPSRTLHRSFSFMDGCEWESEERLERMSEGRYRYSYTEHPVSCAPGRNAAPPCKRSGLAVVTSTDTNAAEPIAVTPIEGCEG